MNYQDKARIPFSFRESGSIGKYEHIFYTPGDSVADWAYDCFMTLEEGGHGSYECYIAQQRFNVKPSTYWAFVSDLKDAVSFALMDDIPKEDRATLMDILEGLA